MSQPPWQAQDMVDWLEETPSGARYLIPDLLPLESLVLMSGQQKLTYKTFTALAAMLAVASGRAMSLIDPQVEGTVLAVEEEGAAAETKQRLLALCRSMGIAPASLRGKIGWAFRNGVLLNHPSWADNLLRETVRLQPALIIFDAMFALHDADENKTDQMARIRSLFERLRQVCGSTILYLAHLNEAHGWNPRSDLDRQVRGSGVFTQMADRHLALRRYKEDDKGIVLKIRSRGSESRQYNVRWEFEVDEAGALHAASIHLAQTGAVDLPTNGRIELKEGVTYTLARVRKHFANSGNAAREFAMRRLQDGSFTLKDGRTWVCQRAWSGEARS